MKGIFYCGFLILLLSLSGCRSWFEFMNGQMAYESKQYALATQLLPKEYEQNTNPLERAEIAYYIGESYRLSNQPKQAAKWYLTALDYTLNPTVAYKYGLMLKQTEQYEEAIEVFARYGKENPLDRSRATRQMNSCKRAFEWKNNPAVYEIESLDSINSIYSDYAPVLLNNEYLVFSSARKPAGSEENYGWTGEGFSNLYTAKIKQAKNRFEAPMKFGETINTPFNEGTVCFTKDYSTMYFTRCIEETYTENFCQIYFSERAGSQWLEAEKLLLFEDSVNVGQPCLSPDNQYLYFSSDALEGFGEKDIYVSKWQDEQWSFPVNLGPEINTEGYEGFPYIHTNGTLYFASNGHAGMGGLDVFSAVPQDTLAYRFKNIKNLQYPINSGADDFGLIFKPRKKNNQKSNIVATGFVSSSRGGGYGSDDIYAFTQYKKKDKPVAVVDDKNSPKDTKAKTPVKPKITYVLEGTVFVKMYSNKNDPTTVTDKNVPVKDVAIEINQLNNTSEINLSKRIVSNYIGQFTSPLTSDADFRISGAIPGYFNKSVSISTRNKKPNAGDSVIIPVKLVLEKIFTNQQVTIDDIYYDLDKWDIRTDAALILDGLAELLYENPNIKIEVGAHTDSRGTDSYNLDLSAKRSASVVDYLSSKGIERSRLTSKGYGETQLVNACTNEVTCSDEDHQKNRRTTFRVLEK